MKRLLLCAAVVALALTAAGQARAEKPGNVSTNHYCSTSSHTSSCYDSDRCNHDRCSYEYCPPCYSESDRCRSDCYSHEDCRPSCWPSTPCYSHSCYTSGRYCSHDDRTSRQPETDHRNRR